MSKSGEGSRGRRGVEGVRLGSYYKLNAIDEEYSRKDFANNVDNGCFREDPSSERSDLVQKILPEKLARYNAFINGYSQLLTHPPTQTEDLIYIKRWLAPPIPESVEDLEHQPLRYIGAIDELEAAFVEYADDLLALESNKRSWFRRIVEDLLLLQLPLVRRFFQRTPQDYAVINANAVTIWQDDGKVDRFMNFSRAALTAVVGLGMLLGPLWVLEKCRDSALDLKLGIITAFVTLFFVLVAVATTARVVEALAAAAAYAAVITVFLQIGSIA